MFYLECSHISKTNEIKFFDKKCKTFEESFNRNREALSVIGIEYATIFKGLEISIRPDSIWNKKEINLIKKARNTNERIMHYMDALLHPANLFYEGIIYGFKYAYNVYAKSTKSPVGLFVCAESMKNTVDITHPYVAFTSANAIWKALDFIPSNPIVYNIKDDSFDFPNADTQMPTGRISEREIEKMKKGKIRIRE